VPHYVVSLLNVATTEDDVSLETHSGFVALGYDYITHTTDAPTENGRFNVTGVRGGGGGMGL